MVQQVAQPDLAHRSHAGNDLEASRATNFDSLKLPLAGPFSARAGVLLSQLPGKFAELDAVVKDLAGGPPATALVQETAGLLERACSALSANHTSAGSSHLEKGLRHVAETFGLFAADYDIYVDTTAAVFWSLTSWGVKKEAASDVAASWKTCHEQFTALKGLLPG